MTDTTYAAKLAAVSTIADLIALNASQTVDLPAPDDVTDPAESRAVRAMSLVSALAPYAKGCGTETDDFETAITDLVGDLRHLADALGVDFRQVIWRSSRYYREELKAAS